MEIAFLVVKVLRRLRCSLWSHRLTAPQDQFCFAKLVEVPRLSSFRAQNAHSTTLPTTFPPMSFRFLPSYTPGKIPESRPPTPATPRPSLSIGHLWMCPESAKRGGVHLGGGGAKRRLPRGEDAVTIIPTTHPSDAVRHISMVIPVTIY